MTKVKDLAMFRWMGPREAILMTLALAWFAHLWYRYIGSFGFVWPDPDLQRWGQLGDYVGGFSSPIIATFALYMLGTQIAWQRRALESFTRQQFDERFFAQVEALRTLRDVAFEQAVDSAQISMMEALRGAASHAAAKERFRASVQPIQPALTPYVHHLWGLTQLLLSTRDRHLIAPHETAYFSESLSMAVGQNFAALLTGLSVLDGISDPARKAFTAEGIASNASGELSELVKLRAEQWGVCDKLLHVPAKMHWLSRIRRYVMTPSK